MVFRHLAQRVFRKYHCKVVDCIMSCPRAYHAHVNAPASRSNCEIHRCTDAPAVTALVGVGQRNLHAIHSTSIQSTSTLIQLTQRSEYLPHRRSNLCLAWGAQCLGLVRCEPCSSARATCRLIRQEITAQPGVTQRDWSGRRLQHRPRKQLMAQPHHPLPPGRLTAPTLTSSSYVIMRISINRIARPGK